MLIQNDHGHSHTLYTTPVTWKSVNKNVFSFQRCFYLIYEWDFHVKEGERERERERGPFKNVAKYKHTKVKNVILSYP